MPPTAGGDQGDEDPLEEKTVVFEDVFLGFGKVIAFNRRGWQIFVYYTQTSRWPWVRSDHRF